MLNKIINMNSMKQMGRYLLGELEQSRMPDFRKTQPIQVSFPKGKPFVDETNKIPPKKAVETPAPIVSVRQEASSEGAGFSLQQAILWSEILGKPMCKRRRNRNRLI